MSTRLLKIIPLTLIFIVIIFLRLYNLNSLPPSLFSDEVDAGYQADTLIRNGTDYFGNFLPTHFHSFSDWRTSGYICSIALVKLVISDSNLSVRLPSVLFSLGSIIIFYLLTKSKTSALLLAISPWSIHYGRTGFEVSGMIFFFLLGIYFLNSKRFFLSVLCFCITPYFYSTAKLFLVLLLPLVIFIYRNTLFSLTKKNIFLLATFSLLVLTPMTIDTVTGKSGFRFSYIGIFTMPHREQIVDNLRYQDILESNANQIGVKTPFSSFIFHNKYQLVVQKFIENYYSSFSTEFLFLKGDDNIRHGFGGHGLLYLIDFFVILFGIYLWSKNKTSLGTLFFYFLLISPIPFSLTRDSNSAHATRLIFMLPSLIYFASLTVTKYKLLLIIYLLSLVNFWHYYTIHYPQESAMQWHTGMERVIKDTSLYTQNIYFSSKYESFVPFFLYYHPYSVLPKFTEFNNDSFSGKTLENKFYFGQFNPSNLTQIPQNSILVIPQSEYNSGQYKSLNVLKKIDKRYINQEEFLILSR